MCVLKHFSWFGSKIVKAVVFLDPKADTDTEGWMMMVHCFGRINGGMREAGVGRGRCEREERSWEQLGLWEAGRRV